MKDTVTVIASDGWAEIGPPGWSSCSAGGADGASTDWAYGCKPLTDHAANAQKGAAMSLSFDAGRHAEMVDVLARAASSLDGVLGKMRGHWLGGDAERSVVMLTRFQGTLSAEIVARGDEVVMGWFSRAKRKEMSGNAVAAVRRDLVVPMISGQAWMDANEAMFAQIPDFPPGEYPAATAITDGLYVTYAVDPGPSWEVVSKDSVAAFGGVDALRSTALANLRTRGDIRIQGASGRFLLTVPDELDLSASLLLDPDRWRAALSISGDMVVGVPTRTVLWACSADDHESVGDLARIAQSGFAAGDGKPVAPTLFRLSGRALSPHSHVV